MTQWEYMKLDLYDVPAKSDEIVLLNRAGNAGWELITMTPNKLAYLKRQIIPDTPAVATKRRGRVSTG